MEVCLSFDNGPEPEATPLVLAALGRRGLTATFFPIARKLRDPARRALAERALAEGHRIGNHTLTHGAPLGLRGGAEAVAEITEAEALLGPLNAGRLFRPNGGGGALGPHLLNASALRHLRAQAYTVVLWNAVPGDFRDPEGWPATALAQCRAASAPVLMVLHDLPNGAMRHLDAVLDRLTGEGARFLGEFPEACLALREGAPLCDLAAISREDIAP
ncbi:polysaccharide deacetylase family protein [Sediminicoccus rosea]|uniref:Chitooligosaccharide deacetylase n=1 Tax=Sediminicoccus rosea TaxID=1225128 RepID=A0ABZ0PH76_9PROT|nr:polysaccharide deacetylase family protein [Sediminicoccus rosea]WPB84732.1 polysaccharide deacetylase family protein [Sediminicoccus rosea]